MSIMEYIAFMAAVIRNHLESKQAEVLDAWDMALPQAWPQRFAR